MLILKCLLLFGFCSAVESNSNQIWIGEGGGMQLFVLHLILNWFDSIWLQLLLGKQCHVLQILPVTITMYGHCYSHPFTVISERILQLSACFLLRRQRVCVCVCVCLHCYSNNCNIIAWWCFYNETQPLDCAAPVGWLNIILLLLIAVELYRRVLI